MLLLTTLHRNLTIRQIHTTRCSYAFYGLRQCNNIRARIIHVPAHRLSRHPREPWGSATSSSRLYSLASHPEQTRLHRQLEGYLPSVLKQTFDADQVDYVTDPTDQNLSLPEFLRRFRQISPSGALSFLAAQDDRLEAFVFLANELIDIEPKFAHDIDQADHILDKSPWLQPAERSISLDALSQDPHVFNQGDRLKERAPKSTGLVDSSNDVNRREAAAVYREAIGELWTALGEMAIRASSLSDSSAKMLMQPAQFIFARMHSQGLVSPTIYNYDEPHVPKARRKPPYLHVLESRMMATMSDASWNYQSSKQSLLHVDSDVDISSVVVDEPLSTHQLRPNVWLEFVMWICVSQSFYVEAARLLSVACLASNDRGWRALTWDQVLALQKEPQKRQQSWFDRLMSVDEGYNQERPLIEMPQKSISCEVIVSILEGLLSLEDSERVHSARRIAFYVYCHSLEDRDEAQALFLSAVIQQLENSSDLDPQVITQLLIQQVQSMSGQKRELSRLPTSTEDLRSLSSAFAEVQSGPYICHALSAWESVILHGKVTDALQLFESIRTAPQLIRDPLRRANRTGRRRGLSLQSTATEDLPSASSSPLPQIPETILAWFLQLLVRTNNLDGVRAILYDEVFGLRNNSKKVIFQPALLQAAVAVGDKELLATTVQDLDIGFDTLPDDVLFAVFEAHIWLGIFNDTWRLLRFIQTERRLPVKPWLVVATACKYITIVSSEDVKAKTKHIRSLLIDMLDGKFLPARDPSQPLDYTARRTQTQLTRILRSAHQCIEALPLEHDVYANSQINNPVAIQADAFNPLLETIAAVQGTDAAREFFDIWCQPSPSPVEEEMHDGIKVVPAAFEDEKVVTPTLETVQIVLRAPIEDLKAWSQGGSRRLDPNRRLLKWIDTGTEAPDRTRPVDTALPPSAPHRELFEWGTRTLRMMGYDDYTINSVIPGTFPDAK